MALGSWVVGAGGRLGKLTVAFWGSVNTSNYMGQFICNPK